MSFFPGIMSQFPNDWEIYPEDDFSTFHMPDMDAAPLGVCALLRLADNGRSLGIYQLSLFGGGVCRMRFPVSAVLPGCPAVFADILLIVAATAKNIRPALNSTTTPWRCLAELIRSGDVLATNARGDFVPTRPLLEYMDSSGSNTAPSTCVGASIRWAVAVNNADQFQLELQCMPTQSRFLVKANLKNDNAVSVLLGFLPLTADMFPGPVPAGMVPLLFASDRTTALMAILQDPDSLQTDISALNHQFLRMEHLTLADAHSYLKATRARAAKGVPAFPTPTQDPPSKRQRTHPADASQTGTFIYTTYFLLLLPMCSTICFSYLY